MASTGEKMNEMRPGSHSSQSPELTFNLTTIKAMFLAPRPQKLLLLRAFKHMKLIILHLNEKGGEPPNTLSPNLLEHFENLLYAPLETKA